MSGLIKGIKKVFKAVVKVIKKILPIVLVVGAIVLTGGAAAGSLGIGAAGAGTAAAGAAGGGGFLSGFLSKIGLGSLTGAAGAGASAAAGTAGAAGAAATGGGLFSGGSGLFGKVLAGAAYGFMESKKMEAEEQAVIDAENRRSARYEGVGDAGSFQQSKVIPVAGNADPRAVETATVQPRGLGGQQPSNTVLNPGLDQPEPPQDVEYAGLGAATPGLGGLGQAQAAAMNEPEPVQETAVPSYKAPRVQAVANVAGENQAQPRYKYNPASKRIEYT